jgi:hypothetical protein
MTQSIQALPAEIQLFAKRARFYNDVVGVLSFSLALGALGTEAPRFYAALSMLFLIVLMHRHSAQYERIYKLWRELDHPLTQVRAVWRSFIVMLVGWSTLGAVALGVLTKSGVTGL